MKRIGYIGLAAFALAFGLAAVAQAQTPNPNGAFLNLRFFNDCPVSTVSTTNTYPALIAISDTDPFMFAGTNKHLWKFSEDGGATQAKFHNNSNYSFCADVVLNGRHGEGVEEFMRLLLEDDARLQKRLRALPDSTPAIPFPPELAAGAV